MIAGDGNDAFTAAVSDFLDPTSTYGDTVSPPQRGGN